MKVHEIIVVEGRDDTRRIKEAVDAETIETRGSAINEATLQQIEHAQRRQGVIILTDPDYPGGRIREIISQRVPEAKHAFIRKQDCQSPKGGSLGIEHASNEVIQEALQNVYTPAREGVTESKKAFCLQLGLIGQADSAKWRTLIGEELGIGHANAKQFVKRLESFLIPDEEVLAVLRANGAPVPFDYKGETT